MEEEYRREENFEQAYEDLDEKDKKELGEIGEALKKIQEKNKDLDIPINDKKLKKRIAKICLKLIEETPKDKTSIMETAYMIAGNFMMCNYGDKLDRAVEIAGDLELPEHHVPGDVMQMWKEMKKRFQKYLF